MRYKGYYCDYSRMNIIEEIGDRDLVTHFYELNDTKDVFELVDELNRLKNRIKELEKQK